ncbi:MAG: PQQ-binding-like beta-propeller repeat protein [Chloroflexota bacterium]
MVRRNYLKLGREPLLLGLAVLLVLVFSGCTQTGAVPRGWSGVAVAGDTLYVGSMQGELVALNMANGNRRWMAKLESAAPSGGGFGCTPSTSGTVAIYGTPAVAGGLVYVTGYNGMVYAFKVDSGAAAWPAPATLGGPVIGGAVVAAGNIYFGAADDRVYALDAASGSKVWEFKTGDKIWGTPVVYGDTLLVGSFDKTLYALSLADGSKKWAFPTEGAIVATPVVVADTVYIGSFDRHFYALDAADGSLKWQFMGENWFWARPLVYNGVIYAANLDGKVYALEAANGNKVAEFDLGSPVASSPVLVGHAVIAVTEAGAVYALDTATRQMRPLVDLAEEAYAPLAAGDGVVYLHTQKDDSLKAVNAETGVVQWNFDLGGK